jgi:hypothetical protein
MLAPPRAAESAMTNLIVIENRGPELREPVAEIA